MKVQVPRMFDLGGAVRAGVVVDPPEMSRTASTSRRICRGGPMLQEDVRRSVGPSRCVVVGHDSSLPGVPSAGTIRAKEVST